MIISKNKHVVVDRQVDHFIIKKSPKISVCIPTYNHEQYLKIAIDSVLLQSFTDFELIIVDNCSTDNTGELVHKYVNIDERVRYICNDSNIGPRENLNRCVTLANGEFIKILCADDFLYPLCLEHSLAKFISHPEVVMVAHAQQYINNDGASLYLEGFYWKTGLFSGKDVARRMFIMGNCIGNPGAVIFRRNAITRGFDSTYAQLIDQEMWFYLLTKGSMAFIAERLSCCRVHAEQQSCANIRNLIFVKEEDRLLATYCDRNLSMLSRLDIHRRKFRIAYSVWMQFIHGVSLSVVHTEVGQIIPVTIFYFCLPFMVLFNLQKKLFRRSLFSVMVR